MLAQLFADSDISATGANPGDGSLWASLVPASGSGVFFDVSDPTTDNFHVGVGDLSAIPGGAIITGIQYTFTVFAETDGVTITFDSVISADGINPATEGRFLACAQVGEAASPATVPVTCMLALSGNKTKADLANMDIAFGLDGTTAIGEADVYNLQVNVTYTLAGGGGGAGARVGAERSVSISSSGISIGESGYSFGG